MALTPFCTLLSSEELISESLLSAGNSSKVEVQCFLLSLLHLMVLHPAGEASSGGQPTVSRAHRTKLMYRLVRNLSTVRPEAKPRAGPLGRWE